MNISTLNIISNVFSAICSFIESVLPIFLAAWLSFYFANKRIKIEKTQDRIQSLSANVEHHFLKSISISDSFSSELNEILAFYNPKSKNPKEKVKINDLNSLKLHVNHFYEHLTYLESISIRISQFEVSSSAKDSLENITINVRSLWTEMDGLLTKSRIAAMKKEYTLEQFRTDSMVILISLSQYRYKTSDLAIFMALISNPESNIEDLKQKYSSLREKTR